ncbi:MAG: T9SS type A sorting domain-containing protein [Candidatus Cloacimonetes bacterium]|nr:T9SS type A sorting domain-containing protein [Candidatus Cloacimonadota bacterium]
MKKNLIIFLVLFCIVSSLISYNISLLKESSSEIEILFKLDDFSIEQQKVGNKYYDKIEAEKAISSIKKGFPDLPYYVCNVVIPDFDKIDLEIISVDYKEMKVDKIIPSPGPVYIEQRPYEISYIENEIYNQDIWYQKSFATLGEPFILRDLRGINIKFQPFKYNSKQGILRYAENIHLKLKSTGVSSKNTLKFKHETTPKSFSHLYSNHFINYDSSDNRYLPIIDEGDMIIISPTDFLPTLQSLVNWKNKKGINTQVFNYPMDTGNSWQEIHSFIQTQYENTNLTFVLLVGDNDQIPAAMGNSGWATNNEADPVYGLLDGDDDYPEIFIGRFSVETVVEAQTVIHKNLMYEMSPEMEIEWQNKAIGIASNDAFPPFPVDWELMGMLHENMLDYNYVSIDEIYDPGASTNDVIDSINEGRGWINYLGHGSATGWNTTYFNVEYIDLLQNENMLPIVISVACNNGNFGENLCLAEAWQRAGDPFSAKGSIVFQGCSVGQTTAGWIAQEEIIDLLVTDSAFTAGGLITNGCLEAIDYYPGTGNGTGSENYQSWIMFGDPSVFIYSDIPTEMFVDYDEVIDIGTNQLDIQVNDENGNFADALVGISQNNILLGSALTNEFGFCNIEFTETPDSLDILEITVTGYNKIPYIGSIQISANQAQNSDLLLFDISTYPNPYYPNNSIRENSSILSYETLKRSKVKIAVYNTLGQLIKVLLDCEQNKGQYSVRWNGIDINGKKVSSGTYLYMIEIDDKTIGKKIMVIK